MRMHAFVILIITVVISGCDARILNLVSLSKNQAQTQQFVKQQEDLFVSLAADVATGELCQGLSKEDLTKRYGSPTLVKTARRNGASLERWLYRMPLDYSASQKVYLDFDASGSLMEWESHGFDPQEASYGDGPHYAR
jgi:hypothetical protein